MLGESNRAPDNQKYGASKFPAIAAFTVIQYFKLHPKGEKSVDYNLLGHKYVCVYVDVSSLKTAE